MKEKNHRKMPTGKLSKTLDKNDPFDQLIMELAQKGVLDVCTVGIKQASSAPRPNEDLRKPIPNKDRHTS